METRTKIRAVLFDLDGTLVDSEPLHVEAFRVAAASLGLPPPGPEGVVGLADREAAARLTVDQRRQEELVARKRERFLQQLRGAGRLKPVRGAATVLRVCASRGIPFGVVTNAAAEEAELALRTAGLRPLVPFVLCDGDAPRGKPAPDPYLAAAERLGVRPTEARAYEDSAAGLASALAAGLDVVRIGPAAPAGAPALRRSIPNFVGEAERLLREI